MARIKTSLFGSGTVALTQDVDVSVPPSGGIAIAGAASLVALEFVVGLSTDDKLAAIGTKTLSIWSEGSMDDGATWQSINRIDWQSYGPGGLTVTDPDGAQWVNRDPTLGVPLNGHSGILVRLGYHAHGIAQSTGVVVSGLKK